LVTWLMDPVGSPPVERIDSLTNGPWLVVGEGKFAGEVTRDLMGAGLTVTTVPPADGFPDLTGIVGLVAGAEVDVENLALAAHARLENPGIFLAVRQRSDIQAASLKAFAADSLFVPSELVAREVLAHIISPDYWAFIDHVFNAVDDDWSAEVLQRFLRRVGVGTPSSTELVLDDESAPAVVRWLNSGQQLTIGQLLADPDERTHPLPILVTSLIRGDETIFLPAEDIELQPGDLLVCAGAPERLSDLDDVLTHDQTVCYCATGEIVAATWLFRTLAELRRRRRPQIDK
jgi:voltage-gated potassium channel